MRERTMEPLSIKEDGEANFWNLHGSNGRWLMRVQHNGESNVDQQAENMRRIVACVNACAGIPTVALESGGLDVLLDAHLAIRDSNPMRTDRKAGQS